MSMTLYRVKNTKTGETGGFIEEFGIECFLQYLKSINGDLTDYKIYAIDMEDVTDRIEVKLKSN